ncbi:hypothetical protein [Anaerosporobacter sp.]
MKKKLIYSLLIAALILVIGTKVGVPLVRYIHENSHVNFADENMAIVLSNALGDGETPKTVTYKDLKKITEIDIGFVSYYSTIKDLCYCTNIKALGMNGYTIDEWAPSYSINQGKVDRQLTKEDVDLLQKELGEILPKLKQLEYLAISNKGGCNLNSIEFLKGCTKLETVILYSSQADDYSVLKTCKSLRNIYIEKSNISKADDLIGIKNLELVTLDYTPLSRNPEELKKLREAYPEAEIFTEE